jgi:hypothetical protein
MGSAGNEFGELDRPAVIAFHQEQKLYMTDSDNHGVQIFFNNGTFASEFRYK